MSTRETRLAKPPYIEQYPQVEVVKHLLSRPEIKPNLPDNSEDGDTPLHLAVRQGKLDVVDVLLHHPAVNRLAANKKGKTARDLAETEQMADLFR
jgi:ankyrin repeat protein